MAFLNGTLKCLIDMNAVDDEYITKNTVGWPELKAHLAEQTWEMLEKYSGTTRAEMQRFADMYAKTKSAIFVWSMGITQHVYGVDNVKAIVNLALARGNVGREKTGVVPIRGHSGVQGGGEMGAAPSSLPGVAMKDHRVKPWEILAITFTNKAAGEMRHRVESLLIFFQMRDPAVDSFAHDLRAVGFGRSEGFFSSDNRWQHNTREQRKAKTRLQHRGAEDTEGHREQMEIFSFLCELCVLCASVLKS